MINDKNIGVATKTSKGGQQTQLFENFFKPELIGLSDDTSEPFSLSDAITPQVIQSLMIPMAVFVVIIYQFYFKAPKAPANSNMSRAEQENELKNRFNNLTNSMGGGSNYGNDDNDSDD